MTNMSELENKFIMMSRIAVLLARKGIQSSVSLTDRSCLLFVHYGVDGDVVECLYDTDCTEEELLNWWSIIEG